ncbi:hypothetical protein BCD67_20535 [Oscillatoriales cyanobacterium USR001]|nr:hypothetical protein BCD67_20535 [Oscillatoriales cyanobacterium USR001]
MKLTYRGTNYEYDIPAADMVESEVGGKYRGQGWNYRYPRHIPVPQQVYDLKYRGVEYKNTGTPNAEVTLPKKTSEPRRAIAHISAKPCVLVPDIAKVHRANLCNILDRRLQVAKARGDEKLLRLLEFEAQQMVC